MKPNPATLEGRTGPVKLLFERAKLGPLAALVATWALFAALAPGTFMRASNLVTMARQTTVVAIAAVGMTLVIVSGGIDLSVGSAVAFTTVVVAATLKAGHGPLVAVLAGVAAATASGAACGVLVARLRMAPFIVTLGAMSSCAAARRASPASRKSTLRAASTSCSRRPAGWPLVPPGVWMAVLVAVAGGLALRYTRFGRHLYAIGSSEATALVCGVDVRVKSSSTPSRAPSPGSRASSSSRRLTVGDPTDSVGLELEVIAAVVIGGASLSGGEGTVPGPSSARC